MLHAASQDLPCLAELGLRPRRLFDTELAARLAGFERVGLASLTEQLLGYTLDKHHSAADWSLRPLCRPTARGRGAGGTVRTRRSISHTEKSVLPGRNSLPLR